MITREELFGIIKDYAGDSIPAWEEHYLAYHGLRFLDTLRLLGPGKGQTLLDVGAFPGHLTLAAHHLGYRVQALTGESESIPSLQMIVERLARLGISTALADVESGSFPYPDETFDVVLVCEIIEHLHFNPYRLLRESFRVLKPGGRILITTPNLNRWENILSLIRGKTVHSDLTGRFDESFSAILSTRHVREYTASELGYLLEGQNKEMYRFEEVRVHYSKALDPPWVASFPARWLDRFYPKFRSTLMVEARRPLHLKRVDPNAIQHISGFHPVEEHQDNMQGIARMLTVPIRWMEGTGRLALPAGSAPFQVYRFHLVYLVPERFPPGWWTVRVKDKPLTVFSLPPDRMFSCLTLVLRSEDSEDGYFPLTVSGPSWSPQDHQEEYEFPTDGRRELGVIWGWDGFLREDCENEGALAETAQQEIRLLEKYGTFNPRTMGRYLRHSFDDRISRLKTLYLLKAWLKPVLRMGKGDHRQLGAGWYFREDWGAGPLRWSGREAEAFLSATPRHRELHLRLFTGDPALSERVTGIMQLEYSTDRYSFSPFTESVFDFPAGVWTDWILSFPHPVPAPSLLRLFLRVNESRIPALRLPASTDQRELGLAVWGMALR